MSGNDDDKPVTRRECKLQMALMKEQYKSLRMHIYIAASTMTFTLSIVMILLKVAGVLH